MTTPSGPPVPKARKRFIPLENNPSVMTSTLHTLGLSPTLTWNDVYSISDPDLLALIPRPAYALLLVFPITKTYMQFQEEEDERLAASAKADPAGAGKGDGEGKDVLWFKQTITNACGLYALLHAACNGAARKHILPGSTLDEIVRAAGPLGSEKRAELIYDSAALESAHAAAAVVGDSSVPGVEEDVELHYVAFVRGECGGFWELDGRRKGPILRGMLDGDGEGVEGDVLCGKALEWGPKAFIRREEDAGEDLRFSLVALGKGDGF